MMRITYLIVLGIITYPLFAHAQHVPVLVSETEISATAIATTATSAAIHMEGAGRPTNQLSLTIEVTPGTSTRVRITCYESSLKATNYAQLSFCDAASPSICKPDVREFTLSDYATVGGKKYIKTRWATREQWVKCALVDPDGGSGTASLYGTRSSQ